MPRTHRRDRRRPAPSGFGGRRRPAIAITRIVPDPGSVELQFCRMIRNPSAGAGNTVEVDIDSANPGSISPAGFSLYRADADDTQIPSSATVDSTGNLTLFVVSDPAGEFTVYYDGTNPDVDAYFGGHLGACSFDASAA